MVGFVKERPTFNRPKKAVLGSPYDAAGDPRPG